MNREESLVLYADGRDAWNAWAEKRLAEQAALQTAGKWVDSGSARAWNDETRSWNDETLSWNDETRVWHESADADFREHAFNADANFDGFIFPGRALFDNATFDGRASFEDARFCGMASFDHAAFARRAWFDSATFQGMASFDSTVFNGRAWFDAAAFHGMASFDSVPFRDVAWFEDATFRDVAWFDSSTFSGDTRFGGASFSDDAGFSQTSFDGLTRFDGATFRLAADFYAARGRTGFSLNRTVFGIVPSFVQAHFEEAPTLDSARIEAWRGWTKRAEIERETSAPGVDRPPSRLLSLRALRQRRLRDLRARFAGDPDLAARWRALKRLAIQGHDHQQELAFFKGELQALRWSVHKPWHAPFWFGLLYQWTSDFGRSLARPFWLWIASVAWFASLYLVRHRASAAPDAPACACIAGAGEPWVDALTLSLRKGLLFLGAGSSDRLNHIYACLYGLQAGEAVPQGFLPDSFAPIIPVSVDALGLVQTVFSAVLIFLFLLAIRNHFRIQ